VPLFTEKGQVSAHVGFAQSNNTDEFGEGDGFTIQAATSISGEWAILGGYYSLSGEEPDYWKGRGTYFEFGAGKFKYYEEKKLITELFVGFGRGSISNEGPDMQFVDANFFKLFIQPSLGIKGKNLEAAFTPRIAYVNYTKSDLRIIDSNQESELNDFLDSHRLVFEPGVTLRGGAEKVKIQLQYSFSTFNYKSNYDGETYYPVNKEFRGRITRDVLNKCFST
jgi:hypothetical protein